METREDRIIKKINDLSVAVEALADNQKKLTQSKKPTKSPSPSLSSGSKTTYRTVYRKGYTTVRQLVRCPTCPSGWAYQYVRKSYTYPVQVAVTTRTDFKTPSNPATGCGAPRASCAAPTAANCASSRTGATKRVYSGTVYLAPPARSTQAYGAPVYYYRGIGSKWTWPGDLRKHLVQQHGLSPSKARRYTVRELIRYHDRRHGS